MLNCNIKLGYMSQFISVYSVLYWTVLYCIMLYYITSHFITLYIYIYHNHNYHVCIIYIIIYTYRQSNHAYHCISLVAAHSDTPSNISTCFRAWRPHPGTKISELNHKNISVLYVCYVCFLWLLRATSQILFVKQLFRTCMDLPSDVLPTAAFKPHFSYPEVRHAGPSCGPLLQRAPSQSSGILPRGGWSNEHQQVDYPDKESVVPILWNIIEMNILIIKLRDEKKKNGKSTKHQKHKNPFPWNVQAHIFSVYLATKLENWTRSD